MSAGLAIFVKTPGHSPLKTRLARDIGRADAEQFHRLAAGAVAAVARVAGDLITPYWAVAEATALGEACWQDLPRLAQGDGDLGQRLDHVCTQLLARHERALLIGADTPQITPTLLRQAVTALDKPATAFVLGPATDGGFWLFGCRRAVPAHVWQRTPWSSPATAESLRDQLASLGPVATLARLRDLDQERDLIAVRQALNALPNPRPEQRRLADWLRYVRAPAQAARKTA